MSKWGVFETPTQLHVMPCDHSKRAIGGHAVSDECWCKPQLIRPGEPRHPEGSLVLVVHQDEELGGYDA